MAKENEQASVGSKNQHITCTSTTLDSVGDSAPEKIDKDVLKGLFYKLFGYPMSEDPLVANIQSEQVIARHKRSLNK
ncbi:MAG: hypothetical protein AAB550_02530 [Patescibacteria group bacterium]